MKIQTATESVEKNKFFIPKSVYLRILLIFFSLVLLCYLIIFQLLPQLLSSFLTAQKWMEYRGLNYYSFSMVNPTEIHKAPSNFVKYLRNREKVPEIYIDVKFKDMKTIRRKRAEALNKTLLIQEADDMVPGVIRHSGKSTKVKMRLKGDLVDHLAHPYKWSFRVKIKGDDAILSMRQFSIQHPSTRGYQGEFVYMTAMKKFGIITPRTFLVNVVLNGKDLGIMLLQEHFSKELLESNQRKESVILKYYEDSKFQFNASPENMNILCPYDNFRAAMIDFFGSAKVLESETLTRNYKTGAGLLRGFQEEVLPASEVFDVELMGRFLAINEYFGTRHAIYWNNLRFYYNPITSKLEPIAFDSNIQDVKLNESVITGQEPFASRMLEDPALFKVYRETLNLLLKDMELLSQLKSTEEWYRYQLYNEFYFLNKFPVDAYFLNRIKYLERLDDNIFRFRNTVDEQGKTEGGSPIYFGILNAFEHLEKKSNSYLEIGNIIPKPIEIISIKWVSKKEKYEEKFIPVSGSVIPERLPPTTFMQVPNYKKIYFQPPTRTGLKLQIVASVQNEKYTAIARPYYSPLIKNPLPKSSVSQELSRFRFFTHRKNDNALVVKQGTWIVDDFVVIPPGSRLVIHKDTRLQFQKNAGIVSYSPLDIVGTPDSQVKFEPTATAGTWQGIVVLNAKTQSRLENVTITGTSGISYGDWSLTGGVTFYKSDIEINNVTFAGNVGEDALNIVHSKFKLNEIKITDTQSDAFDSDFSTGTITGGSFSNIGQAGGGDAVDVSGSQVTVTGTTFTEINDKAISVGERSQLIATKLHIINAGVGAVAKDDSVLEISECSIIGSQFAGMMAYMKKNEYGPGHINAKLIKFEGSAPQAIVQLNSSIKIDGKEIKAKDINVKEMYKTQMKPGLR